VHGFDQIEESKKQEKKNQATWSLTAQLISPVSLPPSYFFFPLFGPGSLLFPA